MGSRIGAKMFNRLKRFFMRKDPTTQTTSLQQESREGDGYFDLPDYIKLIPSAGLNDLHFNIVFGLNISVDKNSIIGVNIDNVMFASDSEAGKRYLIDTPKDLVKDMMAMLTLACGKYIFDTKNLEIRRYDTSNEDSDCQAPTKPVKPQDLN